jgi:hypothetical protein
MDVRRNFKLEFDETTYGEMRGGHFAQLLQRPNIARKVAEAFATAPDLMDPVACYDSFPVAEFRHERVRLENGVSLGGGPLVSVVGGAESFIVAVCTVGDDVRRQMKAWQKEGRRFEAMVLDELASWAVDQIRMQLFADLSDDFKGRGWRTSAVLSPGESSWSVKDQKKIFQLLDASAIGVSLSDGYVMSPLKSLTLVFGAGPRPLGVEDASNCDFCSLKEQCRYREMRPALH